MEKQFASDELVEAVFKIIKANAEKDEKIFRKFIEEYFDYELRKKTYDRKTFFTTNENEIKQYLTNTPLNKNIFNLNIFTKTKLINDEFFFNPKISLTEKQNLINSHSIRYDIKFPKDITNDNFKLFISLIPIEDLLKLYQKFSKDKEKLKIIKEYKPELFDLIEESIKNNPSDPEKYFHSSLFKIYGHISAVYNKSNEEYECRRLLPDDFSLIDKGRFYSEYNIDCTESNIYKKYENLIYGNRKAIDYSCEIGICLTSSNGVAQYHVFNSIVEDLISRLTEIYDVNDIVETMKKLVNNEVVDTEKLENLEKFIKGFKTVFRNHEGGSYFDPYHDYFKAISKEDCLLKISNRFSDIFDYVQTLINKYNYQVFDNTYIYEPTSESELDKTWKIYLSNSKDKVEELTIYFKKDLSDEEITKIIEKELSNIRKIEYNSRLRNTPIYNEGKMSEINFTAVNPKYPSFTAITVEEEIRREEKFKTEKENKNIETER